MSWVIVLLAACGTPSNRENNKPGPNEDPAELVPLVFPDGREPSDAQVDLGSQTCDAGTTAWVQRVLPLVLGRRDHGSAEVQMWAKMADDHGRDVVVRALASDPGYIGNWRPILGDMLLVSRSGADIDQTCHEFPLMAGHDGTLASHIRQYNADEAPFGPNFNMADVLIDSLVADDLSVAWIVNVFTRTNYVPVCSNSTDVFQIELERRLALGDEFLDNYVNRSITCMGCHNGEYSVTDSPIRSEDRTWGVPGAFFEETLFDASGGPVDTEGYYSFFRYAGVVEDTYFVNPSGEYPIKPWGMDSDCGTFNNTAPAEDYLGIEGGYFLEPVAPESTLFLLADSLASGADALATGPLVVGKDGLLNPEEALAYLTAEHIVDRVWELAMGNPLTLPYGYSRNEDQFEILADLTNRFLTSGWSLEELLVAITTNELYNTGLPATCGAPAYGLEPVLYAYSEEDPNPDLQRNGPGDLVHRHYARVLVNTANLALGWPAPDEWYSFYAVSDEKDLATAIGVFLNRSEAGFNGTDLQGVLAWEARFGTCTDPLYPNDFVQQVIDETIAANQTVETALLAIKDRLLADGQWDNDIERQLVEDLLETPLDGLMADAPLGTRRNLGLFCGALTASPRFFLAVEPHPVGPAPPLTLDTVVDCEKVEVAMATQGVDVTCNGWMPE